MKQAEALCSIAVYCFSGDVAFLLLEPAASPISLLLAATAVLMWEEN
jgi:hypothetical protein